MVRFSGSDKDLIAPDDISVHFSYKTRIKFKLGGESVGAKQVQLAYREALRKAFLETQQYMEEWIDRFVPVDTSSWAVKTGKKKGGLLRERGKAILAQSTLMDFPFKLKWGFDPTSARGFEYASEVNKPGKTPHTPGTIIPFFQPGLLVMKQMLARNIKKELQARQLTVMKLRISGLGSFM